MAELGKEDGVRTSKDPSFKTYKRATKGLLVDITGGGVAGELFSV